MNDMQFDIGLLNDAIYRERAFKKYSDHELLEFIKKKSAEISENIFYYIQRDALYINYQKKKILQDIINELTHLISTARYYQNYTKLEEYVIVEILKKIEAMFKEYSRYGAIYMFRHAAKTERFSEKYKNYTGVSKEAISTEVSPLCKAVMDEVLMSPKKVRLIIAHSEYPRTKILGELIAYTVSKINGKTDKKVDIQMAGYDSRIDHYWTEKSWDEWDGLAKKYGNGDDFKAFVEWFKGNMIDAKFQPNPVEVRRSVNDFVHSWNNKINDTSEYTIVIGISHSPTVDVLIFNMIPSMETNISHLIETANFCKVECNEFCYLGKWVKLKT